MSTRAIRPILNRRGRNRKRRLKSFKTEEKAKAYAEKLGIKEYVLEKRKGKIKIKKKKLCCF